MRVASDLLCMIRWVGVFLGERNTLIWYKVSHPIPL